MMFIWILVLGVIVYMYVENGSFRFDRNTNPLNMLDERLARGEVSLEEYKKLKEELRGI